MLIIRQMMALSTKEGKLLLRDQKALLMLFLMPAFFIVIMSLALKGVFEAGTRHQPIDIWVVNQDRGELAGETLAAGRTLEGVVFRDSLDDQPLSQEVLEQRIRTGQARFGLIFAPTYTDGLRTGTETGLVNLMVDPVVNTQLQTAVRETVAAIVEKVRLTERLGDWLAAAGLDETDALALQAELERRIVPELTAPTGYRQPQRPTATEQNVPAYAIFGLFFIMLTLAKSFLQEQTDGVDTRLRMTPLHPAVFLLGKLLPYYALNLLQVSVMFGLGWLVFDLHIGDPSAFMLVSLATALAACGLGVLVASVGRSEAQIDTLSLFLSITLAALGGLMVPAYILPGPLQTVALYTPQAWALKAYQDVIVRGLTTADILPDVLVLAGFALGFMAVGVWRMKGRL